MMRLSMLLTMLLLVFSSIAGAADAIEGPKACRQCGMDRNYSPETRMVITHPDGTSSGLCSFQCALGEIRKPGNGQIKSVRVADYRTKNLIDAQTAIWVVGGKKPGGMNFPAKWAFARDEDARSFMQDNGGELTTYDRLVQIAANEPAEGKEASHSSHHQGHDHGGPGGGMIFNPAFSEDIYHVHPKGMWMANYKYMHMVQSGLRNGTTDVPAENATPVDNEPFGYMMVPTRMTMDMHMVMVMYGVTDRFTLMGMGTYLDNRMSMVMNMRDGNEPDDPMSTSGLGDTEIRGIYQICDGLTGSLGVSLPTGDIKQEIETMNMTFRAPYDMQLGSGTVDFKPALTYNALSGDGLWNWGGQASYTYHPGHNRHGYSLGDNAKVNGWLQRALGPTANWLRFSYNYTQRIDGRDPEIQKLLDPDDGAPTPDADPRNYGGHRIDGFIGTSFAWGPLSLGVEAGLPLYQSLNGLQLKNQWYLTAGIQAMF